MVHLPENHFIVVVESVNSPCCLGEHEDAISQGKGGHLGSVDDDGLILLLDLVYSSLVDLLQGISKTVGYYLSFVNVVK